MNRLQYLLLKLAEEASEISQIALKTSQFGLEEVCPNQPLTNKERVHGELNDLLAIVCILNEEFDFEFRADEIKIDEKKLKISKYYDYSKTLGMVVK